MAAVSWTKIDRAWYRHLEACPSCKLAEHREPTHFDETPSIRTGHAGGRDMYFVFACTCGHRWAHHDDPAVALP